jgi:L-lactate dehydrogenase complex protein LldG
MTARDEVLARVRAATEGGAPGGVVVPREYRTTGAAAPGSLEVIERFIERVLDYRARVHTAAEPDIAATLIGVLDGATSVVVPPVLPASWRTACEAAGRVVRIDGEPASLSAAELDDTAAVVTACRVAIAETGTIVLDAAPDQGRRALTLVPDHHIVVVFADQIVATVPESLNRLDPTLPLTFISGPSATSDIEFKRVEGVHGPRVLDVIVVTAPAA